MRESVEGRGCIAVSDPPLEVCPIVIISGKGKLHPEMWFSTLVGGSLANSSPIMPNWVSIILEKIVAFSLQQMYIIAFATFPPLKPDQVSSYHVQVIVGCPSDCVAHVWHLLTRDVEILQGGRP